MRHWIIKNWRKSILWRHYSVAACCSRSWTSLWTTQHQSQRQTGYCVDCFPVANWAESIACLICWWHCWGAASWGSFLRTANGINPNRTNVKHKMENHNTFVDEWESLHSSPQHNACQNICPRTTGTRRNSWSTELRTTISLPVPEIRVHTWDMHLSTTSIFLVFYTSITFVGISCNNKEIIPVLPETIQKHKEGLQWRLQSLLLGHVQWLLHAVLTLALFFSAQKKKKKNPFCLTLPWPFLPEKSLVGGTEVSVSMECICLWGWLGSIQVNTVNILWK